MVQPASIKNTDLQSTDTIHAADGTGRVKMAVGSKASGLTPDAAWQGFATHVDGAVFVTSDGVALVAGLDGTTVRSVVVDSSGRLLTSTVASAGVLTDRSGTIAAGATAQTLAAVLLTRKYLLVQNVDDGEDLWINFTTAAVRDQPSVRLRPGESFEMNGGFATSQLISVIATTTGHKFTAKEG